GVDDRSIEDFGADLKNNLYRIWNRMSSGSSVPPPVLAVEIPKPHGKGTRVLGVPTVADSVAQTVVARRLEAEVEPIFHPDPSGYPRGRSALDAVAACRQRCWRTDWVIDLDIQQVLRQRALGPDRQGGGGTHRPAVGGAVGHAGACKGRCSCPTAPCRSDTAAPRRGR